MSIAFSIASAIAAITAAYLALRPANVPIAEHAASICDVPELCILENRCAVYELARPNRRAGWLAIVAAVLGAASALSPVFWQ